MLVSLHTKVRVSEVLELTREVSGASIDYARGAMVGLFAGLLAGGVLGTKEITDLFIALLPKDYRQEAIPRGWRDMYEQGTEEDSQASG
jgi:hypothetical protein